MKVKKSSIVTTINLDSIMSLGSVVGVGGGGVSASSSSGSLITTTEETLNNKKWTK